MKPDLNPRGDVRTNYITKINNVDTINIMKTLNKNSKGVDNIDTHS